MDPTVKVRSIIPDPTDPCAEVTLWIYFGDSVPEDTRMISRMVCSVVDVVETMLRKAEESR